MFHTPKRKYKFQGVEKYLHCCNSTALAFKRTSVDESPPLGRIHLEESTVRHGKQDSCMQEGSVLSKIPFQLLQDLCISEVHISSEWITTPRATC